jgi:hypothetical protein
MALDTRNKRSSAINIGSPWRGQFPAPDGSVATIDRPHILTLYAFAADEGQEPDPPVTGRRFMGGFSPFNSPLIKNPNSPYGRR